MRAGSFDRLITILQPAPGADDGLGAGEESWEVFADNVPAQVQDALPSRGERLAEGLDIASRPSRIRIRYMPGVKSAMRVVLEGRTLEIVAGPAELGRRDGWELMAAEYSTAARQP